MGFEGGQSGELSALLSPHLDTVVTGSTDNELTMVTLSWDTPDTVDSCHVTIETGDHFVLARVVH